MSPQEHITLSNFIWSVAENLRGPYRPPQYERVMLPFTVLRRLDAVLAPTKEEVLQKYQRLKGKSEAVVDKVLGQIPRGADGQPLGFHNHSPLDFQKLKGDPDHIASHLIDYIHGFSGNIREIFTDYFEFGNEISKLNEDNRLYRLVVLFEDMDLHPDKLDSNVMGLLFEDLIRRFNEAANETAGDHFTPREVIRLMVNLLLAPDEETLVKPGKVTVVFDPACGTGGMLAESERWIHEHNNKAKVITYGQDYNKRSYAVATSDLLIKGHADSNIILGNTLTHDKFAGQCFDYMLANPPFGVDWKAEKSILEQTGGFRDYRGKLPRVSDGALLFLVHMLSKCQPWEEGDINKPGTRLAIVFNGSPLFTGGAGSGESEIRRWIIENDWLEAIVALPEQMFYNTGISTFIWVLSNRKEAGREGKIQLIDARGQWQPMKSSQGNKRRLMNADHIDKISRIHGGSKSDVGKTFDSDHFGYRSVTIQRPLRLRFQITPETIQHYTDTFPELYDALAEVEKQFGNEPHKDWNQAWYEVQQIFQGQEYAKWAKGAQGTAQKKGFRKVFTERDPEAEPVIAKFHEDISLPDAGELFPGQSHPKMSQYDMACLLGFYPAEGGGFLEYETDSSLKDAENIPLQDNVVEYVQREVLPHWADAWIDSGDTDEKDGGIGRVGYEINFQREFFKPKELRPLEEINKDLEQTGKELVKLLGRLSK